MKKRPMLLATSYRIMPGKPHISAEDMGVVAELGFTLFQTDTDHLTTNETSPGKWDWCAFDEDYENCRRVQADWLLFPHFHIPPPWQREMKDFVPLVCLEHSKPLLAWSLWVPKIKEEFEKGYRSLREHFGPDKIKAFYLGVHGDYGECMFPAACRVLDHGQRQDWINHFGDDHNHYGWWCGDDYAREDFKAKMLSKYGTLEKLNDAWQTDWSKPDEVDYPSDPSGRRRWLDFIEWYYQSMTNFSEMVGQTARRHFPDAMLMFPLGGGDEHPKIGQDLSGLPKMAAKNGFIIRSTHGGFLPFEQCYASQLRRIATACKFYKVQFWTEPPAGITPEGEVSRIFESICAGTSAFWDWSPNVIKARDVFKRYRDIMVVDHPIVDVALLFPQTSHRLNTHLGYPQCFRKCGADLRSAIDFDIVDENLIQDGALKNYGVLIFLEGNVFEQETLQIIEEWVKKGGIVVSPALGNVETVEGNLGPYARLFDTKRPASLTDGKISKDNARRIGKGASLFCSADLETDEGRQKYRELVKQVVYRRSQLDKAFKDSFNPGTDKPGIYFVVFEDRVMFLNTTKEECGIQIPGSDPVQLMPVSISQVKRGSD